MSIETKRRYESYHDFFELNGNAVMRLMPAAAIAVCNEATNRNLVVLGVEGGIWHNPGFEARVDCIWDGNAHVDNAAALRQNNTDAMRFIEQNRKSHDVFVVTLGE